MDRRSFIRSGAALATGSLIAKSRGKAQAADAGRPFTWISTTRAAAWQPQHATPAGFVWNMLDVEIRIDQPAQTIKGFGACFNELGWESLQALSPSDQEIIFKELFGPGAGANFTLCRLPLGANDFSRKWYSYDETPDDFELKNFTIANDLETLVPFIKKAQQQNPDLHFWSSPWSPPTWMKRNHAYAEAMQREGLAPNGLTPEQVGREGQDMFIQEEKYFSAYARYFGKYIDAYREHGIRIGMVMPQNEFNSAQGFPSCTWTPEGLAQLIRRLGPEMSRRHVEIFFGTLERGNAKLLETVMNDPQAGRYISGVGIQWAGKLALQTIHQKYPRLIIYQSEQECGDGRNDWAYCDYCWSLMKDYLENGSSGYMYWNISLKAGGLSHWGWPQNSLVTVNTAEKTYVFNHEYYLLKHVSHFVMPGAKRLATQGTFDDLLAFSNPDGTTVVIARNESPDPKPVTFSLGGNGTAVVMQGQSLNTLVL